MRPQKHLDPGVVGTTSAQRSAIMSKVKGKNTKPEVFVRSLLHRSGFRFRLHYKNLPGTPDIVFPSKKKVIFINGCFWHRHNDCRHATTPKSRIEFWSEKFEKNIARDKKNLDDLKSLGWQTFTVWTCEIKDVNKLLPKLLEFIKA